LYFLLILFAKLHIVVINWLISITLCCHIYSSGIAFVWSSPTYIRSSQN